MIINCIHQYLVKKKAIKMNNILRHNCGITKIFFYRSFDTDDWGNVAQNSALASQEYITFYNIYKKENVTILLFYYMFLIK